jgi:hypothetical protein
MRLVSDDPDFINEPLLFAALVDLTMHPENHDQSEWIHVTPCGTQYCLAGRVALLSGATISNITENCKTETGYLHDLVHIANSDIVQSVAREARSLLGRRANSSDLFWGICTIDDLWEIAQRSTAGRVRRPEGI